MARKRLGERLLEQGVITEGQLADAVRAQQVTGEDLSNALRRLGYVDEDAVMRVLCDDADIPYLDLSDGVVPEPEAVRAIPEALARAHSVLPLGRQDGRIRVALSNPFDIGAVTALERVTGAPTTIVAAPKKEIARLLARAYDRGGAGGQSGETAPAAQSVSRGSTARAGAGSPRAIPSSSSGRVTPSGSSIPAGPTRPRLRPAVSKRASVHPAAGARAAGGRDVAQELIGRAVAAGATNVHLEPGRAELRVRFRVDGQLRPVGEYPKTVHGEVVARLRRLAGLSEEGGRLPEHGHFRTTVEGRDIDLRISTYPTLEGQDVVLQVLDRGRVKLDLAGLGLAPADLRLARSSVERGSGLVVAAGPTGSGRTTTLYSALHQLDLESTSVLTIEDPVVYALDGVRQAQVDAPAGLTFGRALRSVLQHDPDVVLVGEIRDAETAELAVGAALAGRLILTAVAAPTGVRAIERLLDLGVEPPALASALELVVAQRLVRVLCQQCKSEAAVPEEVRKRYGLGDATLYEAKGCDRCGSTGYRGRIGVFELLPRSGAVEQTIGRRLGAAGPRQPRERPTLLHDGIRKVVSGVTSLDEVLSAVGTAAGSRST